MISGSGRLRLGTHLHTYIYCNIYLPYRKEPLEMIRWPKVAAGKSINLTRATIGKKHDFSLNG